MIGSWWGWAIGVLAAALTAWIGVPVVLAENRADMAG